MGSLISTGDMWDVLKMCEGNEQKFGREAHFYSFPTLARGANGCCNGA